jgi:hypothetical protein
MSSYDSFSQIVFQAEDFSKTADTIRENAISFAQDEDQSITVADPNGYKVRINIINAGGNSNTVLFSMSNRSGLYPNEITVVLPMPSHRKDSDRIRRMQ